MINPIIPGTTLTRASVAHRLWFYLDDLAEDVASHGLTFTYGQSGGHLWVELRSTISAPGAYIERVSAPETDALWYDLAIQLGFVDDANHPNIFRSSASHPDRALFLTMLLLLPAGTRSINEDSIVITDEFRRKTAAALLEPDRKLQDAA